MGAHELPNNMCLVLVFEVGAGAGRGPGGLREDVGPQLGHGRLPGARLRDGAGGRGEDDPASARLCQAVRRHLGEGASLSFGR